MVIVKAVAVDTVAAVTVTAMATVKAAVMASVVSTVTVVARSPWQLPYPDVAMATAVTVVSRTTKG
ncbi:hypothetical protein OH492_10285 [Vibrio chagasii]|nr:hypothetical protein [Vibrio chagasii]